MVNFRFLSQVAAEKSLTEKKCLLEKEKLTNKGTDKQYVAVFFLLFLLHDTTHHYQALYQISES